MRTDPQRTRDRLERFVEERLRPAVTARTAPLTITHWRVPGEPVPFAEATAQSFEPFEVGRRWGAPWSTHWLHVTGAVPRSWTRDARHRAEIVVDLGFNALSPGFQAEGLAFRPDGTIIKAVSPRNAHLPVEDDDIDVYLELAGNPAINPESHWRQTGWGERGTAADEELYVLGRLELALVDHHAWALLQDVVVLRGLADQLPADQPRHAQIWHALDRMLDVVGSSAVDSAVLRARDVLAPTLSSPAAPSAHTLIATGHAHIDSAWLWPIRETVRKCARTFSNVVALMDEHPELRFACSSAQQLLWVKERYPDLYDRIRQKVATGQFTLVGGQWVEPDTNMPGAEATVRQLVMGKQFFADEFGVDTTEVWLPDTFGYTAALPQVIRLCGADWFMTQKISWNQTNRMPHHTFWWEGIDGTRVFTHFPPIETYNAELSPAELAHAQRTYADHATGTVSLAPFGWGDGGGGPTREMVAAAHRQADLDGSPRVELGTPGDFYRRAVDESTDLPVWTGEMYLELHRGTLTSQLRTKQGNRRSEELLHHAELWAAMAAVRTGAEYPYDALTRIWRRVLLLQFHDILPGTSIAWVHREAEEDYAAISLELERLIAASLAQLAGEGTTRLLANAAPLSIGGVGATSAAQEPASRVPELVGESEGGWTLRNENLRVRIDRNGLVVSLQDDTGREAIAPGAAGGLLRLHPDHPGLWDAWDVDPHDRSSAVELVEADEVHAETADGVVRVRAVRKVGASTIVEELSLAPGATALDLRIDVDWQERNRLLTLVFPLDVHADRSTSEIQFGHVHRPTHTNTSWDSARFEFVAHRWIHVGESGYGVAVANDSTYGHSVERTTRADGGTTTTVCLSVLRAPVFPDPDADRGAHTLRFAVRPGASFLDAAHEGYRLGGALRVLEGAHEVSPLVTSTNPHVRVETVKLAEDRSGDVVVRLYEASGGRQETTLLVDADLEQVSAVDLLERPRPEQALVTHERGRTALTLRPFQILTLRYRTGRAAHQRAGTTTTPRPL